MGSSVSAGETNSAGPGCYLWGVSQGVALARWGENRGESNGGNALWKRHTWHRVVGDRGKLLIPEPYGSLQRKMLQTEGVELVEFRVDLKKFSVDAGGEIPGAGEA